MIKMAFQFLFTLVLFTNIVQSIFCANAVSIEELVLKIDKIEKQYGSQISSLKATVEKQENHIAQLQDELRHNRQYRHNRQSRHIRQSSTDLNRSDRFVTDELSGGTVAFHATIAYGGSGYSEHLHINQTIIFDNVMLNIGGAYHSQHGLFVANVGGIYIFSVSIMADIRNVVTTSTMVFIMKNGAEVASAIADGRGGAHDQGSTTVVLQLVPGDEVWVSVKRHEDAAIWKDGLDSFMGCLISYA